MSTLQDDIPLEVFRLILSHIPPIDYLKVQLVSKDFYKLASTEFNWRSMTKSEIIQGQLSYEASLPRLRRLTSFVCTHCGLVKPGDQFSDSQAVKTKPQRICVSCCISSNIYNKGVMPNINGEERIPCWHCRKAVPKYQNWEQNMAKGKASLAKFLPDLRSEGRHQGYITADRRTLNWSHELHALAFCGPCLDLMLRHREASPSLRR